MDEKLIDYCWSVKLNHEFKKKPTAYKRPRLRQILRILPFSIRYIKFVRNCQKENVLPFIDGFNPLECHQNYGVPIGGIGCGTIGRSLTGEFCRYQLIPGIYEHSNVETNMFSVCIQRKSRTVYQQALTTKRPKLAGLKPWNTAFPGEFAQYYALYPESWTVYELPGQNMRLTCHQLSPVIPHNYKDSSLPTAIFHWTIENHNDEDSDVSIMFTWQSGSATNTYKVNDVSSEYFHKTDYDIQASGIVLQQKFRGMSLDYCIAARKQTNNSITYCGQFYADDENSGRQLWIDLINNGSLNNKNYDKSYTPPNPNSKLAIALCVKTKVKANSKETIEFSLVWHMPQIRFKNVNIFYNRFYTRFFQQNDTASQIGCYALSKYNEWVDAIKKWRQPIIDENKLPPWYKCALFNELYYVSDGGTLWLDVKDDKDAHDFVKEHGRFGYLEGHEYRMYNTYDVHFYASYALLMLWPKLQISLQYDYALTIAAEDSRIRQYLYTGVMNKTKTINTMPHDIGDPEDEPWTNINAYCSHDAKDWKDLNLKFILQVYRDYYYTKDKNYLAFMWPYIKILVETADGQDHDNDGLIDSEGNPDQTYDVWNMYGASAYCGGLHVSALRCAMEIANVLGDTEFHEVYSNAYTRARKSFDEKLWNGSYYNFDCGSKDYSDTIMADMCCGHWYLRSCGFENEVFEEYKIKSCLNKIYEFNVMKYGNGRLGAVNGMRPDGTIDLNNMESEEVWIGVTASLASLMIYEGMPDKAWSIIEGLYKLLYNQMGLAFQTPEAIMGDHTFRSLGYMRALSLWSVQYAIENLKISNGNGAVQIL